MSKPFRVFSIALLQAVLIFPGWLSGQQTRAVLKLTTGASPSVSVSLDTAGRKQLSFLRSVAGVGELPTRISNLRLFESGSGAVVSFRELMSGEYLAEKDFSKVVYDAALGADRQRNAAAHVSWIKDDVGILMLADILPQLPKDTVGVAFEGDTPAVSSIEMLKPGDRTAVLDDAENSVFLVGSAWRMRATHRCTPCPVLYLSGSWHFTDDEAVSIAGDIADAYRKLFQMQVLPYAQIAIAKFPVPTEPGAWEAETRGRNVTIISSDMPFRSQSIQRLHEQLRHELFHLWIPNQLSLTGNYDWFYEGFALYQSLKLAVALNQIRFEDFLDTLSRAHTIDSAYTQRPSLIDASKTRFGGTNTQVYGRGMLVAFLTDLALIENSKTSVEDLLRKLYRQHRKPAAPVDGNQAVIELMRSNRAIEPIVSQYVAGRETIEWKSQLAAAGIEDIDAGPITTLRVKEKLGGRQKALLDKLGYNNWRKLSRSSK